MREVPIRSLVLRQVPALGGSLLVAELFFKFGSFTLEAVAFLATWFVLDTALQTAIGLHERATTLDESSGSRR